MGALTPEARDVIESGRLAHPVTINYLVVRGRARVTEGGAAELLHRLAQIYVGPGTVFPPMPDPPPGYVVHVAVDRVGSLGPWAS